MSSEWLNFFFSPLSNGLIFVLLALGVFIAFRVLDIADLSVEGLFPFVTVLTCFLIRQGWNPALAVLLCLAVGALTGALNACLSLYLKIPPLLSGIIMMSATLSFALAFIFYNGSNPTLLGKYPTLFNWLSALLLEGGLPTFWAVLLSKIIVVGVLDAIVIIFLYFFFGTELGLAIRASGKNKQMARANGISVKKVTIIGLALSSALVALGASLYAQANLGGTAQDGQGMIVTGLSIIFLGEAILPHRTFKTHLLATFGGSFIYWYIIQILMKLMDYIPGGSNYLTLWKAILLVLVLAIPYLIVQARKRRAHKKEEEGNVPMSESL
jgi:putative tryptophan/tyrosine transport system permease protein